MPTDRRLRVALRTLAALLVVAWFVSDEVAARVPFWVPFAILAAAEIEFVVRGVLEHRRGNPTPGGQARRAPGDADADLGWGELVEDVDEQGDTFVRWVPPPRREPRRSFRAAYLTAAVVSVALLVLAYRSDRSASWSSLSIAEHSRVMARLSTEAGRIAGRRVEVECDEGYTYTGLGSDTLGVAFPDHALTYLRPSICRTLADAIDGEHPQTDAAGEAVLVLAHEAVHLRGERREGVTECLGLQEGVGLAVRLGWSRSAAGRLMRDRLDAVGADAGITRLSYRLPDGCHDGGSSDIRPNDATFP